MGYRGFYCGLIPKFRVRIRVCAKHEDGLLEEFITGRNGFKRKGYSYQMYPLTARNSKVGRKGATLCLPSTGTRALS